MLNYFSQLMDWILPVTCVFCGQKTLSSQPNICSACVADLPWIKHACLRCGLPLPEEGFICGICLKRPPPYSRLQALFHYQFPVDQLILRLKFHQQLIYAQLLGHLLAERCRRYYTTVANPPAMLIPVPLHPKRLRQRGFNQAVELAKPLSHALKIPIGYGIVKRIKFTQAQMDLPLNERAHNVKDAFSIHSKLPSHVAIIDDVVTTGHTIKALCKILRAAGVKQIDVWCVARTSL